MDMSKFIVAKSDQLNSDDLMTGPITVTIERVSGNDSADQPVSVHYVGDNGKPYKPCKSMRRVMVHCWGKDAAKYAGKSMTLRRDPDVQFGGMKVGGIRISHMSHIDGERSMALNATRGKKALYKVLPLTDAPSQPQAADDPAVKWANAYIAKLATMATIEDVQTFAGSKATKLAELQSARPDLHSKVANAVEARIAALGGPSTFDDDDLTETAGPDEEGETAPDPRVNDQADEKSPAEIAVEKVLAELNAATDAKTVAKIEKAQEPHIAFLPEHLAAILETALGHAKARVGAKEEA